MNVEALSRAELLTLLSILEGELEAQDVVIHALRVSWPSTTYTHKFPYGICHTHCRTSHIFGTLLKLKLKITL